MSKFSKTEISCQPKSLARNHLNPPPNWLVSIVKALLFVFNSVPAIGSHGDSTATLEVALDVPADGFVLRT